MRQLGKALTIVVRQEVNEAIMHADVDAYYAPSECHRDVARGEAKRARRAWRHAKSVSGMSNGQFRKAMGKVTQRMHDRLFANLSVKLNPFMG